MRIKIAFAGLMRSGKDTCGDYVLQTYGGVSKRFAAPLYDILAYTQKRCRLPQGKDRHFLQYVGTEWGRGIDQNIWVNILVEEVRDLGPSVNVVVTDARFINEFETLKKEGFILVHLVRPDTERQAAEQGGISAAAAVHASERDVLEYTGFDYTIQNDGSLVDLYCLIDRIIQDEFENDVTAHEHRGEEAGYHPI